jgi:hypothetical protein
LEMLRAGFMSACRIASRWVKSGTEVQIGKNSQKNI